MIAGGQAHEGLGKVACEGGAVLGRGKVDVGVDGERGERLVDFTCAAPEITDFAHDAGAQCDEMAGGEPVFRARRIGGCRAKCLR